MFEYFTDAYSVTHEEVQDSSISFSDSGMQTIISMFGGKTFNNGIYRIFRAEQVEKATEEVRSLFSNQEEKQTILGIFGYDWMGRYWGLDKGHRIKGEPEVFIYDFASGILYYLEVGIQDLHNELLVNDPDASLESDFYGTWLEVDSNPIPPNECIGFIKPLFLDGTITLNNLKRMNLDSYIKNQIQLLKSTGELPDGVTVNYLSAELNMMEEEEIKKMYDYLETCHQEASPNNKEFLKKYDIDCWTYDNNNGSLQLILSDDTRLTYSAQIAGMWNESTGIFLWAWANPSMSPDITEASLNVKNFGDAHSWCLFSRHKINCNQGMAWQLATVAEIQGHFMYLYRGAAGNNLYIFFVFGDPDEDTKVLW